MFSVLDSVKLLTLAFALLWEDVSTCFKLQLDVKQYFFFSVPFKTFYSGC